MVEPPEQTTDHKEEERERDGRLLSHDSAMIQSPPVKIFWLSFCDTAKKKGDQFLGGCVVEVTDEEAREALTELVLRFPDHREGAEWIAAATRKASRTGCNPGGEVAGYDITDGSPSTLARYQRNRLYSRAEIEAIDADIRRRDATFTM